MLPNEQTRADLIAELKQTRARLNEARDTLEAIRSGKLDAIVGQRGTDEILPMNQRWFRRRTGLNHYRTLIETISEGAAMIGRDGTVVYCNSPLALMLGLSLEEVLSANFRDFLAPTDVAAFQGMLERARQSIVREELGLVTTDKRRVPAQISLRFTKFEHLTVACMVVTDLTERERLEQETARARDAALETARMKSEFLANMSHEIRTPLNSIMGMATILLNSDLREEQRECARTMEESGEALLSIVNDILDFSKMAAGKLVFEEIDFELESTVGTALTLVSEQAERKGLEVAVAFEADVPRLLRGDPARLRQVLLNLLSNAVKFTACGEIVTRVSRQDESLDEATLLFEVRDTGIGISREAQQDLFQAFNQVDVSDSREHGGTGLGLAIARELVARMGGTIGVISKPGAGSTFWFTGKFEKQGPHAQVALRSIPSLEKLRVLVIDDNETNRNILVHQLASWNIAADAASGAEEALRMLRAQARLGAPFGVALLDMHMPVMDGLELARRIRGEPAIAQTILIILSSISKQANYRVRSTGLDIKAWLLKPVKPSDLYGTLAEAVGHSAGAPAAVEAEFETPLLKAAIAELGARERKLHALIVEDNATNRKVALWHLEKLGIVADAVATGAEAVDAITRAPYDVVLMDCRMPKLDGYETTRRIRQREGTARHTTIVAMTAHALTGDREKCLAAGMDDYISKPIRMDALVAALGRVLELRAGDGTPQAPAVASAQDGERRPAPSTEPAPLQTSASTPTVCAEASPSAAGDGRGGEGEESALDAPTMESLRTNGDLLGKLIDIFLEEVPEQLAQVTDALAHRDGENAAVTAHGLKGAAATFGAMRMRELAESVERAADRGNFDSAQSYLERLRAECARVRCALEMERTGQTS